LWTDEEIEARRLEELQELRDENAEEFAPGTFGCHELLDRTSLVMNQVSDLLTHPSCTQNKEWYLLAHKAFDNLFQLYQHIGDKHLGSDIPVRHTSDT
jgi:hypothetical protein